MWDRHLVCQLPPKSKFVRECPVFPAKAFDKPLLVTYRSVGFMAYASNSFKMRRRVLRVASLSLSSTGAGFRPAMSRKAAGASR
jgi:hypothetical protein